MLYLQILTDYFIISLCHYPYTRGLCAIIHIQGVWAFKWPLNKGPFTRRDNISWPLVASSKWSLNQGKI